MILYQTFSPVFILAPSHRLWEYIRMGCGFRFDRRPGYLVDEDDAQRLFGLTKFHVIQATSPREMAGEGESYSRLVERVYERFLLNVGRGPDGGMGNTWSRVVLP
jgi:hypothetical protein